MPGMPQPITKFGNLLPVGRYLRPCLRISHLAYEDPFWTFIAYKPKTRLNAGITVPGHQFSFLLNKVVANDLNREVVKFPVRHLDQFVADQGWRIERSTCAQVYQSPTAIFRLPLPEPAAHRHGTGMAAAALRDCGKPISSSRGPLFARLRPRCGQRITGCRGEMTDVQEMADLRAPATNSTPLAPDVGDGIRPPASTLRTLRTPRPSGCHTISYLAYLFVSQPTSS